MYVRDFKETESMHCSVCFLLAVLTSAQDHRKRGLTVEFDSSAIDVGGASEGEGVLLQKRSGYSKGIWFHQQIVRRCHSTILYRMGARVTLQCLERISLISIHYCVMSGKRFDVAPSNEGMAYLMRRRLQVGVYTRHFLCGYFLFSVPSTMHASLQLVLLACENQVYQVMIVRGQLLIAMLFLGTEG